jgi:hypothetical protein
MIRNLKSLGLALMAVAAFGVVGVSAASAAEFHSEGATTTLTGTQTSQHVFTTTAGTVKCNTATFSGTQSGATTQFVTVTPFYSGCTAFGFINVPIHVNGCTYTFDANNSGQVQIKCPAGKVIEITTPGGCTTTIGSQSGLKSTSYSVEGSGTTRELTKHTNISGLHYGECGTTRTNGTLVGTTKITVELFGKHVGFWWT